MRLYLLVITKVFAHPHRLVANAYFCSKRVQFSVRFEQVKFPV